MFIENLVIGDSLEALLYSFLNEYTILMNTSSPPGFYSSLGFSLLGEKKLLPAWTKVYLYQSFLGKVLFYKDLERITLIDDDV